MFHFRMIPLFQALDDVFRIPLLRNLSRAIPMRGELKRALAVHMTQLGFKHRTIQAILGVPSSFISTWKKHYQAEGLNRLPLRL